jgi:hypothetical protein
LPHFLCDTGYAFGFDHSNGKPSEPGNVLRPKALAYSTAIFIVVPIEDVMAAILNAPMAPIGGKNVLCVGFFG